jgi:hypothetical protein
MERRAERSLARPANALRKRTPANALQQLCQVKDKREHAQSSEQEQTYFQVLDAHEYWGKDGVNGKKHRNGDQRTGQKQTSFAVLADDQQRDSDSPGAV